MNWDDAKYFLAVARAGQMLSAASRLGVSQATLSRRITSLEQALDCRLFDRSTGGCILTNNGNMLLEVAERIEAEFINVPTLVRGSQSDVSGTVRIGAPDGFGVAFLSRHLHHLTTENPDLDVQLVPIPRSFSLSQREADIAVMVGRPEKGRLLSRKLVDYSLGLYASKAYLEQSGVPTTLADLSEHKLIGYVEDLIFAPALNYTSDFLRGWHSKIEISSALGQFEAVKSGAGIGVLHDFMALSDESIVRLFPQNSVHRSYYTVWHESMKNTRRIATVAQFLDKIALTNKSLFCPEFANS
ncbi:LysR family transcriptional regulator [Lentilitoribacter sp. EG35]|uniref:LysR family transcriptional regulator n=1 Tax=Lentilitoribacter sp. EG35 TaxID=3234192 RepID=UPI003460660A